MVGTVGTSFCLFLPKILTFSGETLAIAMPGPFGWYLFLTWQYLKSSWLLAFIAHGLPATEQSKI